MKIELDAKRKRMFSFIGQAPVECDHCNKRFNAEIVITLFPKNNEAKLVCKELQVIEVICPHCKWNTNVYMHANINLINLENLIVLGIILYTIYDILK